MLLGGRVRSRGGGGLAEGRRGMDYENVHACLLVPLGSTDTSKWKDVFTASKGKICSGQSSVQEREAECKGEENTHRQCGCV